MTHSFYDHPVVDPLFVSANQIELLAASLSHRVFGIELASHVSAS